MTDLTSKTVTQERAAESSFDDDLVRLDQIRRAHKSARPTHENPAWINTHMDCSFLLSFIDKLWKEYSHVLDTLDATRRELDRSCQETREALARETAAVRGHHETRADGDACDAARYRWMRENYFAFEYNARLAGVSRLTKRIDPDLDGWIDHLRGAVKST